MSRFPSTIFEQREIKNIPGMTYDPDKKTTVYAEDLTKLGDEITAIEEYLENTVGGVWEETTGGIKYMSGKVGINNAAPAAQLDIVSSSATVEAARFKDAPSSSAALTSWVNSVDTVLARMKRTGLQLGNDTNHILVNGETKALVLSAPGATAQLRLLPYYSGIYFQNTQTSGEMTFGGNFGADLTGVMTFACSYIINFGPASSPSLSIKETGFVGVGNTAPTEKLDVNGNIKATGTVRTKGYTVATLPAGTVGDMAYVTNALTPSYLATVVGGGSQTVPVFYNGTNWIVH